MGEKENSARKTEKTVIEKMGHISYESEHKISPAITIKEVLKDEILNTHIMFSSENEEKMKAQKKKLPKKSKKKKNQILLEGFVEASDEENLSRTKSLTDDDLEELKGCVDLGFAFSYDEIPELCNTLPALELCYSMSQKYNDEHQKFPENSSPELVDSCLAVSSPVPNWKISSPGDHPEDVKARLKYWAQAVACTVRLCN